MCCFAMDWLSFFWANSVTHNSGCWSGQQSLLFACPSQQGFSDLLWTEGKGTWDPVFLTCLTLVQIPSMDRSWVEESILQPLGCTYPDFNHFDLQLEGINDEKCRQLPPTPRTQKDSTESWGEGVLLSWVHPPKLSWKLGETDRVGNISNAQL